MPSQYENLIVGVDWVNYFFSLLLFGFSLLLIVFGKKVLNGNNEMLVMFGFLVFVWLNRVVMASFIEPWPLELVAWPAYLQLVISWLIFVIQIVPLVYLIRRKMLAKKL